MYNLSYTLSYSPISNCRGLHTGVFHTSSADGQSFMAQNSWVSRDGRGLRGTSRHPMGDAAGDWMAGLDGSMPLVSMDD